MQTRDLSNTLTEKQWIRMIQTAVRNLDHPLLTQYEYDFLAKMIRANDEDRPIWSPSLKQWNYLHEITNRSYMV